MNQKNTVLYFLILFLSMSIISLGQGSNGFYVYGNTGYKFGSVFTSFPNEFISKNNNISNAYERLGGGNTLTMAGGWMFYQNLGIEISSTYTIGGSKQFSNGTINNNAISESVNTSKSTNLHTVGSIVAQFPYKNFYFYAKAGIVFGCYSRTMLTSNYVLNGLNESYQYTIDGRLMRWFNGSLGFLYKFSNQVSLMIEAEEVSVQGSFKDGYLTQNYSSLSLPTNLIYQENMDKN